MAKTTTLRQQDDDLRRNVARRVYPIVAGLKRLKMNPKTFGLVNNSVFSGFFEIPENLASNMAVLEFENDKYEDQKDRIIEYLSELKVNVNDSKKYTYPDSTEVVRLLIDIKAIN